MAGNYNITIGLKTIGAIASIHSLKDVASAFVELSDKASSMNAKLAIAGGSAGKAALGLDQVREIAQKTRSPLEGIATLYTRIQLASQMYGASQQQIARTTETVAKGLKIMGANTEETSAVMIQLSQALNKGYLNGDEMRSMLEAAPNLINLIAASIAKVDSGPKFDKVRAGLQKMGSDGKITGDIIIRAFSDMNSRGIQKLDENFKKIPPTFEQIKSEVMNMALEMTGAFSKGLGLTNWLQSFVDGGDKSMKQMIRKAEDFGSRVRNYFKFLGEGLGDWAKPIYLGAKLIFGDILEEFKSLAHLISVIFDGLMDLPTRAYNLGVRLRNVKHRAMGEKEEGFEESPSERRDRQNAEEQAQRNKDRAAADRAEADARRNDPSHLHGPPPKDPSDSGRSNHQAFVDFERELAARGIYPNRGGLTGERTYAQQKMLFEKYGPGGAAAPGNGAHERSEALDLPTNVDRGKVEEAARAAGIKGLKYLVHGEGKGGKHTHAYWTGHGKKGEADTGNDNAWEQAEAQKIEQYNNALESLHQQVQMAGMDERDLAAAQALVTAGLEPNIKATDAASVAIVKEAYAAFDAKKRHDDMKKALEEEKDGAVALTQARADLAAAQGDGGSAADAEIDAINRRYDARLKELQLMNLEVAVRDRLIDQARETADAEVAAVLARRDRSIADAKRGESRKGEDTRFDLKYIGRSDSPEAQIEKQRIQIEREKEDTLRSYAEQFGKDSAAYIQLAKMVEANAESQIGYIQAQTRYGQTKQLVDELEGLFTGLFTNTRETMKAFFADLIKQLLRAIAYALIFKKSLSEGFQMGGGGGGGGLSLGNIASMFFKNLLSAGMGAEMGSANMGWGPGGSFIGDFAPGTAPGPIGLANGGTASKDHWYRINEKGQEYFMPGVTGSIIPNNRLGSMGGNGAINIGSTNITVNNANNMDERQLAVHVASAQERSMRQLIRDEMGRKR